MTGDTRVRVGLTLPSFAEDPEVPITIARAAETAGLDGVFVFDHLFRRAADGTRRPALEAMALLGAVAAETTRVRVGTLVARASLRPAATLGAALETVQRVSRGRLIVGVGAGDEESREENESFGIPFGTMADRVAELAAAVDAARGRGFPVWVGGTARAVRDVAAERADGWNRWGGTAARFASHARELADRVGARPFTLSWGGLVVVRDEATPARDAAERLGAGAHALVGSPQEVARALRAYREAGATWIVLGPVDSADPANAERVASVRAALGES
ncbi:MAG: LLM class flavin-dependent oxidoreductase [Acidimicrobiia bacterium]